MEKKLRHETIKRLHYLHPKLFYIENELKYEDDLEMAFYQTLGVQSQVNTIIDTYFDELMRKQLAVKINHFLQQYAHHPETHETLCSIKSGFPHYKLEHIPKVLYQLKLIEFNHNT